jgi:outer membrane protein assembly factor BamB
MSGSFPGLRGGLCVLLVFMMTAQGAPAFPPAPEPAAEAALPRAADDWPQFHYNAARSGATAFPAPAANTTIWSFRTGGPVNESPAVADGVVFVPSADGYLYALNYSTGAQIWKAPGGPYAAPAVAAGIVYAGSEDGSLRAFRALDGTPYFSFQSGSPVRTPVLVFGTSVFFGNDAGNITALDPAGAPLWTNETGQPISRALATDGSNIFACSGSALGAHSMVDGKLSWAAAGAGDLSHPAFHNGRVFAGSDDGWLRAFDALSGAPRWSTNLGGAVAGAPACSGGTLYAGTAAGRVHVLNTGNGSETNFTVGAAVLLSAALASGSLVLGTASGVLRTAADGTEAWRLDVPGGASSSPAVTNARAFIGTAGGNVVAFGFRHTSRITSSTPATASQGTLLSFSGDSPDCTPVAYEWRSDLDGLLSTKPAFSMSTLTLGLHTVSFRIQDSNWTWSAPESVQFEITPSDEWPTFCKDTSRRGFGQGEAPQAGTVVWKTAVGGNVQSSPVVYGGMVFVTSRGGDAPNVLGTLNALDAGTGAVRWTYRDTYGSMDSPPACADGMVFVGDGAGTVIAFDADPSDGVDEGIQDIGGTERDIIWSYKNASVWGSPVVAAGKVIVPFKGSSSVFALDEFTGTPVWKFQLPDPSTANIYSSPAVEGGLVLFGSSNKRLYALDLETGREAWNFTARGGITGSPSVYGGTVFVGSDDTRLYALNLENGTKKWERPTGDEVSSTPAYANGKVFFGSRDTKLYALDAETGEIIWNVRTNGSITSSPAVGGGLVIFSSFDGRVYAINVTTQNEVWRAEPDPGVVQNLRSSPALVNGRVYIGTELGNVVAFGKAPDLDVPSAEIAFSAQSPAVGRNVTVTARIYNRGTLNASADVRMSDGLPGIEIRAGPVTVPMGQYVEFSGDWTVQPGVHAIVVNVTNTTPREVTLQNNQGSRLYTPPPRPGWTMFKGDPARTAGRPDLAAPNNNTLDWSASTAPGAFASPVTAGNRLYQASGSRVFAFDARDGTPLWTYDAGSPIRSTPAVSNILVFGTSDGRVVALNEWDGSLMWTLQTGGDVRSSPLIVSENVFVGSSDGYLYALRLSSYLTGTVLWKAYLGGPVLSSPAYDAGSDTLVVGSHYGAGGGRIFCLRLADGSEAWSFTAPAPVASTPALQGGLALAGCDDGLLYALEMVPDGIDEGLPDPEGSTSDLIWAANLSGLVPGDDVAVRSSPAVEAGLAFVGAGANTLAAVNLTTGQVAWHRALGDPVPGRHVSSPAAAEGRLFVGAGALYALNARTGETVWSYSTGDWFSASPAVSADTRAPFRGVVHAVSEGGGLLAFSTYVKMPPAAAISSPANGQTFRVGEPIFFDGRASRDPDGEIISFNWSLGDGNWSSEPGFTRSYEAAGAYNISLTVRDDKGLEGRASVEIGVRNNSAPRLDGPSVDPVAGDVNTPFRLKVTYFDADNDPARNLSAVADGTFIPMAESDPDDQDTTDGKDFYCETVLPSGIYALRYEATDGVLPAASNVTPEVTVTNRSVFRYQGILEVELFYAGRGGLTFGTPISTHEPYPGRLVSTEILISETDLDRWWWANISYNYSGKKLEGVNTSTYRLYWVNPGGNWTLAENAGIDPARNITFANVTRLGNFTVIGQPPVNRAPVARLGKDITIWEGETATLNGNASYDPDGDVLKYYWDYGEGANRSLVPGDRKAEHKYMKAGRYTVTLVVNDTETNSTPATLTVTVRQRGGEQYVLILVVIIVLVVGILFFLPRGDRKAEDRWKEEDERFRKDMEEGKRPVKKGRKKGGEEEE